MRCSTGCSALQAAICWSCATSARVNVCTIFPIVLLRRRAALNGAGRICQAYPATRTTAVVGDGTGPSDASIPEARRCFAVGHLHNGGDQPARGKKDLLRQATGMEQDRVSFQRYQPQMGLEQLEIGRRQGIKQPIANGRAFHPGTPVN